LVAHSSGIRARQVQVWTCSARVPRDRSDLPGPCRYWLNARSAFLAIIFLSISIVPAWDRSGIQQQ